jgi:hypothetical protein
LVSRGGMHGRAKVLFSPPYRSRLLLMCGTVMIGNLTTQATVFAIDYMQTQRHLGTSAANLVLVGAGLICLPVLVGAGRLSDLLGRRVVCSVGLIIQAAGIVAFFNVADNVGTLLATLAVAYLGLFAAWTTGSAFGVEAFPTALRALAGSVLTMAKLFGQCASFVISAVLVRAIGHAGLVVALLAVGPILAAISIALWFPETSKRELVDEAVEPGAVATSSLVTGTVS